MEAPLHKLCGTRHWSHQSCPVIESQAKASKAKPAEAKIAKPDGDASRPSRGGGPPVVIIHPRVNDLSPKGLTAIAEGIAAEAPRKRGRPRLANPKSPRAAYQRELMRRRYAAKKANQSKRED